MSAVNNPYKVGEETYRQARDAQKTVACYLGRHHECVFCWLCKCKCHVTPPSDVRG